MFLITGCGSKTKDVSATTVAQVSAEVAKTEAPIAGSNTTIALITMDSIDQHWVTLNEGAQKAAREPGVTAQSMIPNTKDDAQQVKCVNNAVSAGTKATIVTATGPDVISSVLKEAQFSGVRIVYVDSPANVEAETTSSTGNKAAGKTVGGEMPKALKDTGVISGFINIINVSVTTDSCAIHEGEFRSTLEGSGFILLETQCGKGDVAKSQSIAENYITRGIMGVFSCNESPTTEAGNTVRASDEDGIIGAGSGKSDATLGLIDDGYSLCIMAQNPDVVGSKGVEACVKVLEGEALGGAVTDTGVSVLKK